MNVEIIIVAKDYDAGKQATRKEEVEIPSKTLKLFEMFSGNNVDGLLRWVADTIFGVAIREAQGGGRGGNISAALVETGGGRVGGRSSPGQNQVADKLGDALGLDIIRNDVKKQSTQQRQPQAGPGPIGFQPSPQQPMMGSGPIGFGNERQINPGPGPGAIGFGPDRDK